MKPARRPSARHVQLPLAPLADLRTWYDTLVCEIVSAIEDDLRLGRYREWRDFDSDVYGPGNTPRELLEDCCDRLIHNAETARLVRALSPRLAHVINEHGPDCLAWGDRELAAMAMARDVLAEARRQGIRAPRDERAWRWRRERHVKLAAAYAARQRGEVSLDEPSSPRLTVVEGGVRECAPMLSPPRAID
jgi:hypothetical protein